MFNKNPTSNRDKQLDNFDRFASNVNLNNFEGRKSIYSSVGIACSVFFYIVMTAFLSI
jgi:hypothetical protein